MNKLDIYRKLSTAKSIGGASKSKEECIKYYGGDYESKHDISRRSFLQWLVEKDLSASSKATIASTLSNFYYVMGDMTKEDKEIICRSFKPPKKHWGDKSLDDKVISKAMVYASRTTNTFTAKRNTLSLMLLACFGLRVGQLTSLDITDVAIKDNIVSVNITKQKEVLIDHEKNKSIKRASYDYKPVETLGNGLGYYMERYLEAREDRNPKNNALLVSLVGERITVRYIQSMVHEIGKKMNISLHPHALRHHVASRVVKQYGIFQTAVLLDHKQITTTQKYLSRDDVDTMEVLDGLKTQASKEDK